MIGGKSHFFGGGGVTRLDEESTQTRPLMSQVMKIEIYNEINDYSRGVSSSL